MLCKFYQKLGAGGGWKTFLWFLLHTVFLEKIFIEVPCAEGEKVLSSPKNSIINVNAFGLLGEWFHWDKNQIVKIIFSLWPSVVVSTEDWGLGKHTFDIKHRQEREGWKSVKGRKKSFCFGSELLKVINLLIWILNERKMGCKKWFLYCSINLHDCNKRELKTKLCYIFYFNLINFLLFSIVKLFYFVLHEFLIIVTINLQLCN